MPRPQRKTAASRKPATRSSAAAAPTSKENRDAPHPLREQSPPAPESPEAGTSLGNKRKLSEPEQDIADKGQTPPKRALATPPESAGQKSPRYGRRRSSAVHRLSLTPVARRRTAADRLSGGSDLVLDSGLIDGISPIKPGRPAEPEAGLGLSDHDLGSHGLSVPLHGLLAQPSLAVNDPFAARTRADSCAASKADTLSASKANGSDRDSDRDSDSDDFDLDALVARAQTNPRRKGAPTGRASAESGVELPSRHRTQKANSRVKAKAQTPVNESDDSSDSQSDANADAWQPKRSSQTRRTAKAPPAKRRPSTHAPSTTTGAGKAEAKAGPALRGSATASNASRFFDDIDKFELAEERV